jgi:NADPH-dependent glutamate synthase beta subunit-like oxidoreductase
MSPVEGRLYIPKIDPGACGKCGVCSHGCPAELILEQRSEESTLRGHVYQGKMTVPNVLARPDIMPPCQEACPLHQDIRACISLIGEGAFHEALEVIRETNPLPSVTGYVCHHPCEAACTRNIVDSPPSIKALKRFVTDYGKDKKTPRYKSSSSQKIVVIGSGPAGLTASYDLVTKGYPVEIIEARNEPGGMLRWAIPDFRLPRNILTRDIEHIKQMGVVIKTGIKLGSDLALADLLRQGAAAVIVAVGTQKSMPLDFGGRRTEGLIDCLDFLYRYANNEKPRIGEKVVVIGGGNAALDAARTALRCGARDVQILYRRSRDEMPADKSEICHAEADGVKIVDSVMPLGLNHASGHLDLKCVRTAPDARDSSGRYQSVPVTGSEFIMKSNTIISAIGQKPDLSFESASIGATPDGLIVTDKTGSTSLEGVFAAGDAVSGPGTVVQAMAQGRLVAGAVDAYITGRVRKI